MKVNVLENTRDAPSSLLQYNIPLINSEHAPPRDFVPGLAADVPGDLSAFFGLILANAVLIRLIIAYRSRAMRCRLKQKS
jgi:hypothetical protein